MAFTMLDLGYNMTYIDLDKKAKDMRNLDKYFALPGRIDYRILKSTLIEKGSLKERLTKFKQPPKKQPQGYLEFVDLITEMENKPPEYYAGRVICTDSGTRLQEHIRRFILHAQGRGVMEIQDWGVILSSLEELFETYFSLPFAHNILILHEQVEKDELTSRTEILPLIDGQMKQKVGSYVSEMYYMRPETRTSGAYYQILSQPKGQVKTARTSRGLKAVEAADFAQIFKDEKHTPKPWLDLGQDKEDKEGKEGKEGKEEC